MTDSLAQNSIRKEMYKTNMTWIYIVVSAAALLLAIAGGAAILKSIKKRRNTGNKAKGRSAQTDSNRPRRTPYKTGAPVLSSAHGTTSGFTTERTPRITQDNSCMRYPQCPSCHSRNTLAKQYIFKTGKQSFRCSRCDHRFTL